MQVSGRLLPAFILAGPVNALYILHPLVIHKDQGDLLDGFQDPHGYHYIEKPVDRAKEKGP